MQIRFEEIKAERSEALQMRDEALRTMHRCEHEMIDHLMKSGKGDLLKVRWDRIDQLDMRLPS